MRMGLLAVAAVLSGFAPAVAMGQTLEAALAPSGSPAAGFVLAAALGLALRMAPDPRRRRRMREAHLDGATERAGRRR